MGMGGTMTMTTYIKGNKMRTDTVMGDTTRTMIFDVDAQKLYSFDSKKKEADVVGHAGVRRQPAVERRQSASMKSSTQGRTARPSRLPARPPPVTTWR